MVLTDPARLMWPSPTAELPPVALVHQSTLLFVCNNLPGGLKLGTQGPALSLDKQTAMGTLWNTLGVPSYRILELQAYEALSGLGP